jgi:hypothetical protein
MWALNSDTPYIKHIYWMTEKENELLREEIDSRGIKMRSARGVVCTPLNEKKRLYSVAPEVWNETCSRQGSWYRRSEKNGLFLVVSPFELAGYGDRREAVITLSDLTPPRPVNIKEKKELINDPVFIEKVPAEWHNVSDRERRMTLSWVKRLGSDVADYDFLFLTHTSNHANFIRPRFSTDEGRSKIPFSIDRSANLCSCCLEIFQVIGENLTKKLVTPCAGAVIFAGLEPDRFLLVERVR